MGRDTATRAASRSSFAPGLSRRRNRRPTAQSSSAVAKVTATAAGRALILRLIRPAAESLCRSRLRGRPRPSRRRWHEWQGLPSVPSRRHWPRGYRPACREVSDHPRLPRLSPSRPGQTRPCAARDVVLSVRQQAFQASGSIPGHDPPAGIIARFQGLVVEDLGLAQRKIDALRSLPTLPFARVPGTAADQRSCR